MSDPTHPSLATAADWTRVRGLLGSPLLSHEQRGALRRLMTRDIDLPIVRTILGVQYIAPEERESLRRILIDAGQIVRLDLGPPRK